MLITSKLTLTENNLINPSKTDILLEKNNTKSSIKSGLKTKKEPNTTTNFNLKTNHHEETKNDFFAFYNSFNKNNKLLYDPQSKISLNLELNGPLSLFEYSKILHFLINLIIP